MCITFITGFHCTLQFVSGTTPSINWHLCVFDQTTKCTTHLIIAAVCHMEYGGEECGRDHVLCHGTHPMNSINKG